MIKEITRFWSYINCVPFILLKKPINIDFPPKILVFENFNITKQTHEPLIIFPIIQKFYTLSIENKIFDENVAILNFNSRQIYVKTYIYHKCLILLIEVSYLKLRCS